jgi:hypothetical protein
LARLPESEPGARFREQLASSRAGRYLNEVAPEALSGAPTAYFAEDIGRKLAPERLAPPPLTGATPSSSPRAAPEHTERAPALSGGQRIARGIFERSRTREQRQRARVEASLTPAQRAIRRQHPTARIPGPEFYKLPNASPAELARQLRRHRNRRAIAAIRIAAFSGKRGWNSAVACGVIRHALAVMMLADQRGVVRDVPINLLKHANRDRRTGKLLHRDTIGCGQHRPDGDLENGQCGYGRLLVLAGFMSQKQYRKKDPSRPEIPPSCSFYTLCEAEVPLFECTTQEQCDTTLAIVEFARIPHPHSGIHPRASPLSERG